MPSGKTVVIVGVTGAVGQDLLAVLAARRFPVAELRPCASPRSAGSEVAFGGRRWPVRAAEPDVFEGADLALFSAGAAVSRALAPAAVERGALVVDNSSAFRLDDGVPLVVPECNAAAVRDHRGLIANPNCSTILLVAALRPLHDAAGLRRVVVSTYQAASGAGQRALDEMRASTAAALRGEPWRNEVLPHSLAFDLYPRIDVVGADGYTREEDKMQLETRKILELPTLPVEATCVRVPVERCHSEAVSVELERPLSAERARAVWAAAHGVVVEDDAAAGVYPRPGAWSGRDEVAIGRVRASRAFEHGLTFWICGDQLRKGAALNAVQIAELALAP